MGPPVNQAHSRRAAAAWALPTLALAAALTGLLLAQAPEILAGQPWRAQMRWVPTLGLSLGFALDGLGLLFALLITGMGLLVGIYSIPYMAGERGLGRYYGALSLFMLAMVGVVTAGNLITLFLFWELTSISSYLLIGFRHEEAKSRESALQALLITGTGGLALLAGAILIGQVYGTFELAAILEQPELLRAHPYYGWALALALAGALTKSAQFPFHIWLPNAMVAPTPVSAYLHSATMVKAGLYLLLRLSPLLGGSLAWQVALLAVGGLTMLLGAWRALGQRDLKAILAYTTISTLGMIVALVGLGSEQALEAALILVVAHALYKGALFLVAGAIDHETGTRDVALLGGLRRHMPLLAALALLAACSMAGLPPTFGFLAKELGYTAATSWPAWPVVKLIGALLFVAANAGNVALALVLGYRIFAGSAGGLWPRKPQGASWLMLLPPGVLAAASWLLGLAPGLMDGLKGAALTALLPISADAHLRLWHGLTWPLALSALTLAAGGGLYALWPQLQAQGPRKPRRISASRAYEWLVDVGLPRGALRLTRLVQNGSLRIYLMVILSTLVLLVGTAVVSSGLLTREIMTGESFGWTEPAIVALLVAAALSVVMARTRVGAIICLGAVGTLMTLFYVRFRAPDLALTQLVIESLTVILLLLVFHFLPPVFEERPARRRVAIEATVATLVGGLMAALVLVANEVRLAPSVAEYYVANSLALGHGRNVVNVILVDFRGFDTLGEITVLATAALGVYMLLKLRRRER